MNCGHSRETCIGLFGSLNVKEMTKCILYISVMCQMIRLGMERVLTMLVDIPRVSKVRPVRHNLLGQQNFILSQALLLIKSKHIIQVFIVYSLKTCRGHRRRCMVAECVQMHFTASPVTTGWDWISNLKYMPQPNHEIQLL